MFFVPQINRTLATVLHTCLSWVSDKHGSCGKSPYPMNPTQSFPEEHQFMCFLFRLFVCPVSFIQSVSLYLCVCMLILLWLHSEWSSCIFFFCATSDRRLLLIWTLVHSGWDKTYMCSVPIVVVRRTFTVCSRDTQSDWRLEEMGKRLSTRRCRPHPAVAFPFSVLCSCL